MGERFRFLFQDDSTPEPTTPPPAKKKAPSVLSLFTKPEEESEEPPPAAPPLRKNCAQEFNEDKVFWAMRDLPVEETVKNMLICGMVGSGKTVAIQLFLQSIAPRFKPGRSSPEQLIIFDAKSDVIPTLAALGLKPDDENVYILNPFDERSMIWDLGEAVQEPALARGFATLLVPEEKGSSAPFFASAARDLVNAVILALNHVAGTKWTFRDLLCALDSEENIRRITARHETAHRIVQQLLGDKQHYHAVLSTLATKLAPFHQTAALWHTSESSKKFSIEKFLKNPGVLILGNDPVLRDSLWPINAAMLRALTAAILRGPNTMKPRHWFVLDEFRAMEKVEAMHDLLNRGRSKGASVLLGIQSVEGLMEVYQENGTEDILSQCSYKCFLRAGGPKTAKWASDVFGQVRWYENSTTQNFGKDGSHSVQTSLHDRQLLLPSYFLNLPFPGLGKSYTVVSDVPSLETTFITTRPFDTVLSWCQKVGDSTKYPSVIPRNDIEDQTLRPWSPEETYYFCRTPEDPKKPASTPSNPAPTVTTPDSSQPPPPKKKREKRPLPPLPERRYRRDRDRPE